MVRKIETNGTLRRCWQKSRVFEWPTRWAWASQQICGAERSRRWSTTFQRQRARRGRRRRSCSTRPRSPCGSVPTPAAPAASRAAPRPLPPRCTPEAQPTHASNQKKLFLRHISIETLVRVEPIKIKFRIWKNRIFFSKNSFQEGKLR